MLGLAVLEAHYFNDPTTSTITARLDAYVDIGIESVRIDPFWYRHSWGNWQITERTKFIIEAAQERGLPIKLIVQTIKDPPAWLMTNPNARFRDNNGRLSNDVLISYWYNGIREFSEMALRAQLDELRKHGLLDAIGAIHVDLGMFGEPIYPNQESQLPQHLSGDGIYRQQVMWCYGDNAIADFRVKMQAKYGTIAAANHAWGTNYASFTVLTVPKPGEVRGQMWEDVLNWYYQVKRDFQDWQVGMFKRVIAEYYEDMPLIIMAIGGSPSRRDWDNSVRNGTFTSDMALAVDAFVVDLADKYGCLLQYTGVPNASRLASLLTYMHETGRTHIPIYGESAGTGINIVDPAILIGTVGQFGLAGFDFALFNPNSLFEPDLRTPGRHFRTLETNIARLRRYMANPVRWTPPQPQARGDVLRYDVTFGTATGEDWASSNTRIATMNYMIAAGDVLEYDVFTNTWFPGVGGIDAILSGETIRFNDAIRDQNGYIVNPASDLSMFSYYEWFRRELNIGHSSNVGKRLTEFHLATNPWHPIEYSGQSVTIWYDNIRITNNGVVKLVIFESAGDINLANVELVGSRNITSATVRVVDVSDAR
jgi:hypothetical protein